MGFIMYGFHSNGCKGCHKIMESMKCFKLSIVSIFLKDFIKFAEYFVMSIRVFTSFVFTKQNVSPYSPHKNLALSPFEFDTNFIRFYDGCYKKSILWGLGSWTKSKVRPFTGCLLVL